MKVEVIKKQPINEDVPMYYIYQDGRFVSVHYNIDKAKEIAHNLINGTPKEIIETILTLES